MNAGRVGVMGLAGVGALVLVGCGAPSTNPVVRVATAKTDCGLAAPHGASPKLRRAGIAYDKATNQVMLFGSGAISSATAPAETWAWTPTAGWSRLTPRESPPPRTWASMTYDEARHKIVLFGGQAVVPVNGTELPALNDTWTWDGKTWSQEHPAASPPATASAPMAYDPGQQAVILLRDNSQSPDDETGVTWKWDGSSWSQLRTTNYPTAPKQWAGMAYDAHARELAVFGTGAYIVGGHPPADAKAWTLTAAQWSPRASNPAGGRSDPALAPDARGRVLVFGGELADDPTRFMGDTWVWDQGGWTRLAAAHAPEPRSGARMVFDASCGLDVLYGGATFSPNSEHDYFDTWVFDGSDWRLGS